MRRRHDADPITTTAATILGGKPISSAARTAGWCTKRHVYASLLLVGIATIWFLMATWFKSIITTAASSSSLQSTTTARGFHQSVDFVINNENQKAGLQVIICGRGQLYYSDTMEQNWSEHEQAEFLDAKEAKSGQECCNYCANGGKAYCSAYFYSGGICSLFKMVKDVVPSIVVATPPVDVAVIEQENPFEEDNPFEQQQEESPPKPEPEILLVEDDNDDGDVGVIVPEEDVPPPMEDEPVSVEEVPSPVEEVSSPVEEEPVPIEEEPVPMEEVLSPMEEMPPLTNEETIPVAQPPDNAIPDLPDFEDLEDNGVEEEPPATTEIALDFDEAVVDDDTVAPTQEEPVVADSPPAAAQEVTTTEPRSMLDFDLESHDDDDEQSNKLEAQTSSSLDDLLSGDELDQAENDDDEDNGTGGDEFIDDSEEDEITLAPQKAKQLSDLAVNTNEVQLSPEQNSKLSQLPISNVLVAGAYSVVIQDPFYAQKNSFKFFGRFRAVSEIHDFLLEFQASQQASSKYPVDLVNIGTTAEGKTIKAMEIGNPSRGKHIFIIGGLRGCDWTGPLASVHSIVSIMGRRRSTFSLLDAVRFHFVPLVNIDGYHYSRRKSPAGARHWCDNRRVSGGGHGANLERNFGVAGETWGFGKQGKDARKDKQGFQGLDGFSEPETQVVRDYVEHFATGSGRVALVHVRCCAGSLSPPQPVPALSANRDLSLITLGANTLGSNLRANGNDYQVIQRTEPFGPDNTGQLIDWAYSIGIDHSYAVEIKAFSVATHNDRYQISPEPFAALAKELEVGVITTAQLLLNQPIQGPQASGPYRPKIAEKSKPAASSKKKLR